MSSQWEVLAKDETFTSGVTRIFTGGMPDPNYRYLVKNVETGHLRTVIAENALELGERISEGDFEFAEDEEDIQADDEEHIQQEALPDAQDSSDYSSSSDGDSAGAGWAAVFLGVVALGVIAIVGGIGYSIFQDLNTPAHPYVPQKIQLPVIAPPFGDPPNSNNPQNPPQQNDPPPSQNNPPDNSQPPRGPTIPNPLFHFQGN
jgi:hypothetical protein